MQTLWSKVVDSLKAGEIVEIQAEKRSILSYEQPDETISISNENQIAAVVLALKKIRLSESSKVTGLCGNSENYSIVIKTETRKYHLGILVESCCIMLGDTVFEIDSEVAAEFHNALK